MSQSLLWSIYKELIAMREDLQERLNSQDLSPYVQQLAEEELRDLNKTVEKIESGGFGVCEETGQPLPIELLTFQPNVHSFSELNSLMKYLKKPVFPI